MPGTRLDNIPRRSTDSGTAVGEIGDSLLLGRGSSNDLSTSWAQALAWFPDLEGREPAQQIELLNQLLEKEGRIKEGADNLLKMQLTDALRAQVASELDLANNKINTLHRAIEHCNRNNRRRPAVQRGASPIVSKKELAGGPLAVNGRMKEDLDKDDLRTARQQAFSHMKTLTAYANHVLSPHQSTAASSSAAPTLTSEADLDHARIESMAALTQILRRNVRIQYEIDATELMHAVSPSLSDQVSKKARVTAFRLLRHAIYDTETVERLTSLHLDWYIVKSLTRDNKYAMEREQVIKLIRTMVEVGAERRPPFASAGSGTVPISESIMRALISVAEHSEDPLRQICCQTLSEILLIDVDLMARTGGMRVLLQLLADGPAEIVPLLATAFLYVIDTPKTRSYLRAGTDLEIALAGVTDAYGKGPSHTDRMRACSKVITVMLRTWSGLIYLCANDMIAIRTMIDTLKIPSFDSREIILDMFFDLLNIKTPNWYQTFISGRRLTVYRRENTVGSTEPEIEPRSTYRLKFVDQYISLLIYVLTHAGLIDALTSMLEETATGSTLSRKAVLLMSEILQLANKLLPSFIATKIQAVPKVFSLAAGYDHEDSRMVGTSALTAMESFDRHRTRTEPFSVKNGLRNRANSIEDPVKRGQRQVEQTKIKMGMQMDDRTFQASILETQVMLTRDHTKWNFEALSDLIEGPLLNPRRLEEAIRVSRFVKRLLSFFHPFAHRFSDIKKNKLNMRWVKLGCNLLTTLMANPDGVRYLGNDDELLPQVVKSFDQLHPFHGAPSDAEPIFSKKRFEDTLTSGYFDMLGTLSKQKDGIELLEKSKVFTALYHLSELRSRDDLLRGIIENIDYTIDGHPRILLSKALTSSYKHIRLYATRHLGQLIQSSGNTSAWMLRLLITQLYDPAPEVCELTVHFLEEVCEAPQILRTVVDMQPFLGHLGDIGHPLLLKFMSTPVGFRYLYEDGYIDREMDYWLHDRNFAYMVSVEVFLCRELTYNPMENDEEKNPPDSAIPPHFYGELAKTEFGCQVLYEKGHFSEFALFIRQHGLEEEDNEIILKLKSTLWAVGNIGTTDGGLRFLEEEEITPVILEIAEQSPVLSVRGTCFFVLGLISTTPHGAEILGDYGWEVGLSPLGIPTGICVPGDIEKFVSIPPWDFPESLSDCGERLKPPTAQLELDILIPIFNLSNTVIANTASRTLARMKSRPEYQAAFSSPSLFYRILHILNTQRYRLPVRRYILDLFNVPLNPSMINTLAVIRDSLLQQPSTPHGSPKVRKEQVTGPMATPGRGARRGSESDGEDGVMVSKADTAEKPMTLRPLQRISGFASDND